MVKKTFSLGLVLLFILGCSVSVPAKLQPLTEQDFHIEYKGVDLTVGIDPNLVIKKLEKATKVTGNREFIGWSSDRKYKMFIRKFPPKPPGYGTDIEIYTRADVKTKEATIYKLDISGYQTKRDIKFGDTLEKVKAIYGAPSKVEVSDIQNTTYIYSLNNKTLEFSTGKFGEKDVLCIELNFNG